MTHTAPNPETRIQGYVVQAYDHAYEVTFRDGEPSYVNVHAIDRWGSVVSRNLWGRPRPMTRRAQQLVAFIRDPVHAEVNGVTVEDRAAHQARRIAESKAQYEAHKARLQAASKLRDEAKRLADAAPALLAALKDAVQSTRQELGPAGWVAAAEAAIALAEGTAP